MGGGVCNINTLIFIQTNNNLLRLLFYMYNLSNNLYICIYICLYIILVGVYVAPGDKEKTEFGNCENDHETKLLQTAD